MARINSAINSFYRTLRTQSGVHEDSIMANSPITEEQGDEIIKLLEKIEEHLNSIKYTTEGLDKTANSLQSELISIEVNTRS
jgi:archaellum component FlaC